MSGGEFANILSAAESWWGISQIVICFQKAS